MVSASFDSINSRSEFQTATILSNGSHPSMYVEKKECPLCRLIGFGEETRACFEIEKDTWC
jgi:hypothetical protein